MNYTYSLAYESYNISKIPSSCIYKVHTMLQQLDSIKLKVGLTFFIFVGYITHIIFSSLTNHIKQVVYVLYYVESKYSPSIFTKLRTLRP